jgi:hypothetical protein
MNQTPKYYEMYNLMSVGKWYNVTDIATELGITEKEVKDIVDTNMCSFYLSSIQPLDRVKKIWRPKNYGTLSL